MWGHVDPIMWKYIMRSRWSAACLNSFPIAEQLIALHHVNRSVMLWAYAAVEPISWSIMDL